jgi:hypothetical protein
MLFIDERLAQCLGRARKDGVPRASELSASRTSVLHYHCRQCFPFESHEHCFGEGGGNIAGQTRAAIRSATEPTVRDPIGARVAQARQTKSRWGGREHKRRRSMSD